MRWKCALRFRGGLLDAGFQRRMSNIVLNLSSSLFLTWTFSSLAHVISRAGVWLRGTGAVGAMGYGVRGFCSVGWEGRGVG